MQGNRSTFRIALLPGLLATLTACGQDAKISADAGSDADETDAAGCVPAPIACSDPPSRFPDVAPIFETRCAGCHDDAPGGPWPLVQYADIAAWQVLIQDILADCTKHPSDVGVSVTPDDRTAILIWILCGALE